MRDEGHLCFLRERDDVVLPADMLAKPLTVNVHWCFLENVKQKDRFVEKNLFLATSGRRIVGDCVICKGGRLDPKFT